MVYVTEAGRAALTILVLTCATVGGAWGYTALNGPLTDSPDGETEQEGVFLVTYRLATWEYETDPQPFPMDGEVSFLAIPVALQNVSTVQLTLQVSMRGPAVNDDYTVSLQDPQGDERTGDHTVPSPSTDGYVRSDTIIDWSRVPQPSAETYQTAERDTAARWSAENRTDTSAVGDWNGRVSLNQPVVGRAGNVSLLLRFTWYEAVVLPQTQPSPLQTPVDSPQANATTNTSFEVPPRTFITSRSVGGTR